MRRRGAALTAAVAGAVLLLDQVTKFLVRSYVAPRDVPMQIIGDLLRFNFTRNEGAAFGLLPGNRLLFIPIHAVVLVVVAAYVWRRRPTSPWIVSALGLVAGGAMGNLVDRVVFGWVTDFIQVPFNFPVFNLADSAIVVGVGILIGWVLFGPPSRETPQMAGSTPNGSQRSALDEGREASAARDTLPGSGESAA